MAPKGLKAGKKKPIDWVETGIQGTTLALSLVNDAAQYAPVPYLRQAAGTTLKILSLVQVCISGAYNDHSTAQFS
jgi:hypothetical protein